MFTIHHVPMTVKSWSLVDCLKGSCLCFLNTVVALHYASPVKACENYIFFNCWLHFRLQTSTKLYTERKIEWKQICFFSACSLLMLALFPLFYNFIHPGTQISPLHPALFLWYWNMRKHIALDLFRPNFSRTYVIVLSALNLPSKRSFNNIWVLNFFFQRS